MSADIKFTKENLDSYLNRLAKEFKKLNGSRIKAEIILVGGASILANYNFREMTMDLDAVIKASSAMKDAINKVGDDLSLPNGWLNSDFVKTDSYSPNIAQYSSYYKQFNHILEVRTVPREYLVAMKLKSARKYKHDLSDAIGIIAEELTKGSPLSLEQIKKAYCNLYEDWSTLPETSKQVLNLALNSENLSSLYKEFSKTELENKEALIGFEQKYPGVTNTDNVNDIIDALNKQKSVLPNQIEGNGFTQNF